MTNQTPLDLDGLTAAVDVLMAEASTKSKEWARKVASEVVTAYLDAQPTPAQQTYAELYGEDDA